MYTSIPAFLKISFPFRSPQSTEFSELYSRFLLVTYLLYTVSTVYIYAFPNLTIHLEKWYRWTYLQSRKKRHREQTNKYMGTKWEREGGEMNWETRTFRTHSFLTVSWTARRSNQSILKEINPEYSLEGPMLKLKCQSFGHLMQRADLLEKTLMLGKIEGRRRRGWQKMIWLGDIINSMKMKWANSGRRWWTGKPGVMQSMGSKRVRHDWAIEQQELTQRICQEE